MLYEAIKRRFGTKNPIIEALKRQQKPDDERRSLYYAIREATKEESKSLNFDSQVDTYTEIDRLVNKFNDIKEDDDIKETLDLIKNNINKSLETDFQIFKLLIRKEFHYLLVEFINFCNDETLISFLLACKDIPSPDRALAYLNAEIQRRFSEKNCLIQEKIMENTVLQTKITNNNLKIQKSIQNSIESNSMLERESTKENLRIQKNISSNQFIYNILMVGLLCITFIFSLLNFLFEYTNFKNIFHKKIHTINSTIVSSTNLSNKTNKNELMKILKKKNIDEN